MSQLQKIGAPQNKMYQISWNKTYKNISYPEAMKLVENSAVTTYANVAKPTNNTTQNLGMQDDIPNKRTENTNRMTKRKLFQPDNQLHTEQGPKQNLQLQTNKAEDMPPTKKQTKTQSKQQKKNKYPYYLDKTQQSPTKNIEYEWKSTANPKKEGGL